MAQPERKPEGEKPYLRPVSPGETAQAPARPRASGMAVAGFILGLASLLVFGVILGPLAIIFGAISFSEINRGERSGRGFATAAVVIGAISFLFSVIYLILIFSGRIPSSPAIEGGMIQRFGLF